MTLGVSPTYLSRIERAELPPPAERQEVALATILGQDPDVFLAAAGRIPSDLPGIIERHPREYAALLRSLRNLRKGDLHILFDALSPGRQIVVEFKAWRGTPEEADRQIALYKAMLSRIDDKPLALLRTSTEPKPTKEKQSTENGPLRLRRKGVRRLR